MTLTPPEQVLLLRPPSTGTATAVFVPTQIAGLSAWYDASVASSISSSGGVVSQWNDLSGGGLHLTVVNTGPTTGSATINGKNAITFNHTTTGLTNTGFSVTATNTGTWFVVLKPEADTSGNGRIWSLYKTGGVDYDNVNSIAAMLRDGTNQNVNAYYNNVALNAKAMTNAAAHQVTSQRNGDTHTVWVDASAGTPTAGLGTTNFTLQNMTVGFAPDTTSHYGMDVAEMLWYNAALSTTDRQSVEAYLKGKWATP